MARARAWRNLMVPGIVMGGRQPLRLPAGQLAAEGVQVLALIWDNASWHISQEVRAWHKEHNRRVKAAGHGCRLLVCRLPRKVHR